jgi:hypothetical protein
MQLGAVTGREHTKTEGELGPAWAQKLALGILALGLLTASGVHLGRLDRQSWSEWRISASEQSLIPADRSLDGITAAAGNGGTTGPLAGIGGRSRVLLFVIHAGSATRDVGFWNAVLARVTAISGLKDGGLRPWGVCDSGAACGPSLSGAGFPIVGYLDAYHMRSVALGDSQREALLYAAGSSPLVLVSEPQGPAATADIILRALGSSK